MNLESVAADVELLNGQFQFSMGGLKLNPFVVSSDGNEIWVEFLGQPLWNSENDDRDEAGDDSSPDGREALLDYLVKEANFILIAIPNKIKFPKKKK